MAGKSDADFEKDRLRQSERTYAVLFSLSFAIVAQGAATKITTATIAGDFSLQALLLNAEMTASFLITAGLFYYQGDRFLDIMFAREPLGVVTPFNFGLNYAINVCQMIPFYLMAHGLSFENTSTVGFTWYFVAYTFLIVLGLMLLFIRRFANFMKRHKEPRPIATLGAFWVFMNSLLLLVVIVLWMAWRSWGHVACPTNGATTGSTVFLVTFGIMVLLRDILDFSTAWRVVYPTPRYTRFGRVMAWFSTVQAQDKAWRVGFIIFVAIIFMILSSGLWNLFDLRAVCKL
ncbi:hypothetical protein G6L26_024350 (plasmid) [Agrobacterium radiobacter]|uniref:Transmembrane protein n=1 Tax=Agrobacterium tumefaciens str. B6 TaxID=1183423 RepID=A0A822VD80_AGRTU|nr:hypothetical protein [Agrobacterium tumefaciens]KWT87353.1 hypothetical protein ASB65_21425 [Agrobacterium tumefaciens str. B6]MQB27681.1 hypothetical protein [Agrobacterium tumefaciens]NTA08511.1 hypothetical protein [Agrobacterium tumefaciens]NTA94691.1 hypothetical protein [Agrobacterium tumefaciens]NTB15998.1 hypothetical protein [Agrobacterium tumefaciens]